VNLPTILPVDPRTTRTWATIHLDRLAANAKLLQAFIAPVGQLMAVLKADAYGHGAIPIAQTCATMGVQHFAVAAVTEASELRRAGISGDIYLLSPFILDEAEDIVRLDLIPFISSEEQLLALQAVSQQAPFPPRFFLTLDTGMGREGCPPERALELITLIRRAGVFSLRLTGIATHFSSADEIDGDESTQAQVKVFQRFLSEARFNEWAIQDDGRGNAGIWLTLANSPATVRYPLPVLPSGARGYLYRAGLLLYGIEPYPGAFSNMVQPPQAILSWQARVTLVKELPAGASLGYGRTYTLSRPSRIATLAAGYADGLSRRLSNCGHVLLGGKRFPVLGRVSMDQCQIDVTDFPGSVTAGMIATLIGQDGLETQSVLTMAETIGTTPHEPTCALSRRVKRLYSYGVREAVPPSLPNPDTRP
jgi:alanine racemase